MYVSARTHSFESNVLQDLKKNELIYFTTINTLVLILLSLFGTDVLRDVVPHVGGKRKI